MVPQIRKLGAGLVIAFLALFAQLNYVQFFGAESIADREANIRSLLQEYSVKRGDIITSDGVTVATSEKTRGRFKYRRVYPEGELYGHITGFYSVTYGKTRIESAYDDQLLGESGVLSMQDIEDRLFESGEQGEDVVLTIDSELQEVARQALGDERGAAVAIEPRTGYIKALWSNPSYDPNGLATFSAKEAKRFWESLDPTSLRSPLVSISTARTYPPGSTFKVVTAAAALDSGRYNRDSRFRDPVELELPLTNETLTNFTKQACADGVSIDLFTALEISCDTTFAILGLAIPDQILKTAERFGFNDVLPFDVGSEASTFPEVPDDEEPLRAYAAIGQGDTAATPLQMALVAAGIANGGDVPRPRLVREVLDPSGSLVRSYEPETIGEAMSSSTASTLTDMMIAVVESGTGTAAAIEGIEVAGKTGTAQTVEGQNPHTWFIGFAPARNPEIAVAVIVENGGSFGSEATGGAVAAPIVKQIMEADRRISGW